MRQTTVLIAILLLACACGGGGSGGSVPAPQPPGSGPGLPPTPIEPGTLGDGRISDIVEAVRERNDVPALGAIVVSNGQIVDLAARGLRSFDSGAAVTNDDQWHLGSITKAMTATLAAILVEQSVISWDTTPLDIWPQDAATMHPQYQAVTIVDLLSHQAGLRVDIADIPSLNDVLDEAPGTIMEKRRLWARELLETAPVNSIGDFLYTNAGYVIVGAMLEAVTGTPWETMMTNQVFGPLGMDETGFGAPGTPGMLDQPRGHWIQNGSLVSVRPGAQDADNPRSIGPAGTVHATLADYARYMFAHLDGENGMPGLVTASTFQFLHTPVGTSSYALGWEITNEQDWANGPLIFHFGSNVRWYASAGLAPMLDTGVLIVTNIGTDDGLAAMEDLAEILALRIQNSQ